MYMQTYDQLIDQGKYYVESRYGVCNLINAIDYFYELENQICAVPIIAIIHDILTKDRSDFNDCLIRLFIFKFHNLP